MLSITRVPEGIQESWPASVCLQMANLGFRPSSLVLLTAISLTQSLVHQERINVSSGRNSTNGTFCFPPKLNIPGAILKWRKDRNNSIFFPGEKAEYVCKEHYRQIGWLNKVTCNNATWKQSSTDNGYCLTTICNGSKTFNCTDGSTVIDVCHMCDCVPDCPDASDEMSCNATLINVTGQAIGVIKYPVPSPHKSVEYAGVMECKRTLWTDDPGFYIKLWFTNFSLPPNCELNHVSLENVTFTDPERSPACCEQTKDVPCRFGEHSAQPPLSRSITNWITVVLVTNKYSSSVYAAKWFNINGFFPNGVIPRKDASYPTAFKIINTTPKSADNSSLGVNQFTLAIVLFSLIVFVVGSISACMLGKRWIGPSCSFAYCWTRISLRLPRRVRRPESSLDDSLEASPLVNPLDGQRASHLTAAIGSLSSSSSSNQGSVHGSTEHVA